MESTPPPFVPFPPTEANKVEVVKEGAVPPLLLLSRSHNLKVQRNAAGALLNLTHVGKVRGHGPNHFPLKVQRSHCPLV